MKIERLTDRVGVVLLGSFNPKIFHPSWLAFHGLISPEQADDADVVIVHNDITQFTAGYIKLEIQTGKFTAQCDSIHKDLVRDLVLTAFGEHLPHSPVWQIGINRMVSYSCGSESVRNQLGALLAPRIPWGPWGEEIEQQSADDKLHGGMIRLVMRQMPRPDGLDGHIQADVRPIDTYGSAIAIDINSHFHVSAIEETTGCQAAMAILQDNWQASIENANYIIEGLVTTMESLE